MLRIQLATACKRDLRRLDKQGKDKSKFSEVVALLQAGETLPKRYQDHVLQGEWRGYRDLHIEPNWVLIYKISGGDLHLARTGSHPEVFG
ncbi:type II toxin-antitoxin system YafQ family toxin [Gimibacter soli]|uniref:Type II toxin-antitoxin system YafQ family toxin n=1 Tax=Gimibacter soli TaxID=3024400 RepID=A0AAF0BKY2_9PROT|nr:type II toxin-antitoxin system YafQ family toxin [Gimibacter soli]WCL53492.1 type II toxin-antitoxin system YafQ family toxin [Gimibacter soli]